MKARRTAERMLVVRCSDWSVAALGRPHGEPVLVLDGGLVHAASAAARRVGVRRGQRRREAQSLCPEVEVVERDRSQEVRAFEAVLAAVEAIAPKADVVEPGCCAVPTRGPSRYFGGDEALRAHAAALVEEALRGAGLASAVGVGVADGLLAATLAAGAQLVVEPGRSAAFLSPQPLEVLPQQDLVGVLRRLGIRTLGDLAALPAADVLGRFGSDGARAQRAAAGWDEEPFSGRVAAPSFVVREVLDPPLQRVDEAAFLARNLAAQLSSALRAEGLACHRLRIQVETVGGGSLARVWRHDGWLGDAAIAERVRWQLEAWLQRGDDGGPASAAPLDGIEVLELRPEGIAPDDGTQLGFWGTAAGASDRVNRALVRVQGMLGHEAVVSAVLGGGRGLDDQVQLVPWGDPRAASRSGFPAGVPSAAPYGTVASSAAAGEVPPWPGQVPAPHPATVIAVPVPAEVLGPDASTVAVDAQGLISARPTWLERSGQRTAIVRWSAPWLLDERWWDPHDRRRCVRMQVVLSTDEALLLVLQNREWSVVARYD